MNKFLLSIAFISLTIASTLAQGTIAPLNRALTRFLIHDSPGATPRRVTAADNFSIYVFYGPSADELVRAPGMARIGQMDGVMIGLPSIMPLPGTEPGQTVALQIRACNDRGWYASTDIRQVTLGPTEGDGTVIWQVNDFNPNRFTPLVSPLGLKPADFCVPEPSTWALGALFGAFLLFRLRKTTKPN